MKALRFEMPAVTSLLIASALLLMLGAVFAPATAAPEPLRFSSAAASNSGFISNPSIYTYTIANTGALNKSQQQQQQQQQYQQQLQQVQMQNAAANDVVNGINFATSTNYHSSSITNSAANAARRNFYITNNLNAKESAAVAAASPAAQPTQPAPMSGCNLDRLAVYKVVLHTYWTRDLFPKHYPDWRPSAQWTKTIGRTHDASYALYHIGQPATMGVKQYAETGKTEILDSVAGEQQQQLQQQQQQIGGNSFVSFVPTATAAAAAAAAATAASVSSAYSNQTPQPQPQPQRASVSGVGGGGYSGNIMDGRSVFDEFSMPAILNGAGRSEAKFFVDSNHSLVSLMTRIVPSPDWYIGVDSFQLCVGGSWIDTVTVELDPLDAGTDNGFTFTAPNWPTSPQGVIYRITARYPAHPAGSFFYPKSKRLPPIATFQFIKLKEYELSEVFNFAEDDRKYETVKTQTHLETEHNHVEMNNELSASIERERQNEIGPQPTSSVTERDRIRSKLLAKMNPGSSNNYSYINSNIINNSAAGGSYSMVPKNDKNALMQNIANSYQRSGLSASSSASAIISSSSSSSSKSTKRRRTKGSRDCRVSHWTDWSPCSKTCGIGEMHRYRKVIKHGKRGGRPCPALQESKWCGTEKGCHSPASYFNWSNT